MFSAAVLMTLLLEKKKLATQQQQQQMQQQQHHRQGLPLPQFQQPYPMNPMPLGSYYSAVRSIAPQIDVRHENHLQRLYSQSDMLPYEFSLNPIPDPTLMARPPVFWQSSEVDRSIVQDQGNLRYIR
jgi:hypothetical protein